MAFLFFSILRNNLSSIGAYDLWSYGIHLWEFWVQFFYNNFLYLFCENRKPLCDFAEQNATIKQKSFTLLYRANICIFFKIQFIYHITTPSLTVGQNRSFLISSASTALCIFFTDLITLFVAFLFREVPLSPDFQRERHGFNRV